MRELPGGTVTFLFTDIEGSTRLAAALADRWPGVLQAHGALMRESIAAEGGLVVGTEGDSFFAVFDSPVRAVAAAAAAQRALAAHDWPQGAEIRVRMGLHTGEGVRTEDGYAGIDVHRAARINAAGHGGQVLVSESTRILVESRLPPGIGLRELGRHRLKDLTAAERIHQLVIAGLQSEFPSLRSLDAAPNNLPTQLTSFLGRESEIAEVTELLGQTRLLTLTGPGGTGKTRLALEVATRSAERYPDGTYFIGLAALTEAEQLAPAIGLTLGLLDRDGRDPLERVIDYLRDRQMLMLLDNFEQVSDAAAVVASLLAGAPKVTVLATSRSALHVYGEQEYGVPPLTTPDPRKLPPVEALVQYEAVALFIERARAALPSFTATGASAQAIAEICHRLDGLPLAIELAAARIKLLSPSAILDRLDHRLNLPTSGSRDLPERQRTLRGAIEWSYDLLADSERRLFACLSTFVGGARLDAVEDVCAPMVDEDPLELLASLIDKSLVHRVDGPDAVPRVGMLETIRAYATECAAAAGQESELHRRHAAVYVNLVRAASSRLLGAPDGEWLDRLEEEHDNIRAALTRALRRDDAETALSLVTDLWRFWQQRGFIAEGMERTDEALALPSATADPRRLAAALDAAGGLAYWLGDMRRARVYYERALALYRNLGDQAGTAEQLYNLSFTYFMVTEAPDFGEGGRRVSEALELYRELGDRYGTAKALWVLSNTEFPRGDFSAARSHVREAVEIFRQLDERFMLGWALYTTASLDYLEDDLSSARSNIEESLNVFRRAQDISALAVVLDIFGAISLKHGDRQRAARISGAVSSLEAQSGTGLLERNRQDIRYDPSPLQNDDDTARAFHEGAAMDAEAAISYALETGIGSPGG